MATSNNNNHHHHNTITQPYGWSEVDALKALIETGLFVFARDPAGAAADVGEGEDGIAIVEKKGGA
jgi:hypothetical protein